jgi:hypothetical protein
MGKRLETVRDGTHPPARTYPALRAPSSTPWRSRFRKYQSALESGNGARPGAGCCQLADHNEPLVVESTSLPGMSV